jgi:hypothetical protein
MWVCYRVETFVGDPLPVKCKSDTHCDNLLQECTNAWLMNSVFIADHLLFRR